jgi:membrane protein DedA with SNARE-associated domain
MEHEYVHLLSLLAEHPAWTYLVVFLAALLEAIAVIGTFIPGSTAMFLAGALVGTGAVNLGWVLAFAIAGAVAGDGMSYWLGSRYKDRIVQVWPFRKHPQVLDAAHRFFEKHGAKSVVFARFMGPLRAIVPVVAGMLDMAPTRFYAMNVFSALLWAPAHILPGMVFGASVQLAGGVSFRLVIVIALLAGIIWGSFRVARFLLSHASEWSSGTARRLANWARHRKGRVGDLALRMLDSGRPGVSGIAATSILVLLSGWLFLGLLEEVVSGDPLAHVDVSVYHFLQSVRTPWSDALFSRLATLGSIGTLAALVATGMLWMVWQRRWRTLGYWLAAVVLSQLMLLAIQVSAHRAPPDTHVADAYVFLSNHVAATVIVYGFLAFVLARGAAAWEAILVATTSAAVVVVVALVGLYFGQIWFSDALASAALASVWVAVLALNAMWRYTAVPPPRRYMPVVLLVLCASVAVQLGANPPAFEPGVTRVTRPVLVTQSQWADSLWKLLPCYRSDMEGDPKEPLTLQWASTTDEMKRQLRGRGWVEGTNFSVTSLFSLVSSNVAVMGLPVLPKLNNGVPSPLVFTRPGDRRDKRDVLRFWPTDYAVNQENSKSPIPIWTGSLVHERLVRPSWPINMLRAEKRGVGAPDPHGDWPAALGAAVVARVHCHGVPLILLASREE